MWPQLHDSFRVSVWGECSVTCGEGVQKRKVVCMSNQPNAFKHLLPSSPCQGRPKFLKLKLIITKRNGYKWLHNFEGY